MKPNTIRWRYGRYGVAVLRSSGEERTAQVGLELTLHRFSLKQLVLYRLVVKGKAVKAASAKLALASHVARGKNASLALQTN